jgi:hypothetical protein
MILKLDAVARNPIVPPALPLSSEFKQAGIETRGAFCRPTAQQAKKSKKAVDTLAASLYFDGRSYWAGLQEP